MKKIIDFKKYSSIKIGPKIEVEIIEEIDKKYEQYFLIGKANNILISNTPPKLATLSKKFDYIKIVNDELIIGAATPTGKVVSFCKKHNIGGFEFLSHLPGSIGGAIKMNAGVKEYEIKNILKWVRTYKGKIEKENINMQYRKTDIKNIIYEAGFKMENRFNEELRKKLINLRKNQPKEPSAGSIFKNPKENFAGRLIEEVGLKGKRVGNMAISNIHANFLVNLGNGTFEEAMELINMAKEKVLQKYGIKLEEEIIII
ncbi:UDP-N-acetylmuramate dehydrogenase [Nitrosophilus kaiyonis]|uniref:UDP-N-acetylmuramate dehydrogenase n=1 Tax=Nitrosophilus kaiyonis TaxID=2930200 RepID=UPI0024938ABB|nr:UDP-N-acetylmuramate dehydrogenase [Nitrosophilus kaiyonis]